MYRSRQCLRQQVNDDSIELLKLYKFYEQGNLLVSGGVYDQPAVYLSAMQLIDDKNSSVKLEKLNAVREGNI